MTFLWALISWVETIAGLRGTIGPEGRRPAPAVLRPIIGRPGCWPGARTSRRPLGPAPVPARGSYCTRLGMLGCGAAERPVAAEGAGIGTPGRPVQYSTPVLGAVLARAGAASGGAGGGGDGIGAGAGGAAATAGAA